MTILGEVLELGYLIPRHARIRRTELFTIISVDLSVVGTTQASEEVKFQPKG